MCRLAAYRGIEITLERIIHEPPHSLMQQAWQCKELQGTTLNADGYGFGWYLDDAPEVYRSTLPIWSDGNLPALCRSLRARHWAAYVRSATPGQPLSEANTQPFARKQLLFMHNGRIEHFNDGPRQQLHAFLDPEIAATIEGNTDSEYLFALLHHYLKQGNNEFEALQRTCTGLEEIIGTTPALLTMILMNGNDVYCTRHAVNGASCPTLYYTLEHPGYPAGLLLASERFSEEQAWHSITGHTCMHFDRHNAVNVQAL